ncbi:SdrD B-like domain-containing protein [Polaromonas naphthalenivorans]|uniref:SD-repeat containing protein B domain-containing protein n=1 Tax=Polaromonas naphthalenivorans (strain CJ2) TaxID=365044 RepID=A1VTB1_POLNA|nr:SdrD B-like domain-containing protein [Polaromonas naphthalenivorans]ABM38889.1 hypothetical protein Pnap_3593 [Polaromonas naphthalenivorans CJ2]
MKGAARPTRALVATRSAWLRAALAGLAATAATAALAQEAKPSAAAPKPDAPYVDRVMDSSALPEDDLEPATSEYNATGWPRSLRVDASVFSQRGASTTLSRAVGVGGFLDTPDHGALSINANLTQQRADESVSGLKASTWRIDQRAMPLDAGWRANHGAGDINTGSTSLARGIGRVFLPTTPIRGLGGQWHQGDAIDLNAAAGRTGLFNGLDLAGFQPSGGRVASAGGQFRLPTGTAGTRGNAAFQVFDGRGITEGTGSGSAQDTRAFFAATAWEGAAPWAESLAPGSTPVSERQGGLRLQGNAVRSTSSRSGDALGLWADAAWRTERWRNTAGVFRFEPNLRWGTAVLASDLQGAYWQADTSTRQWQAGFATELSDSVSRAGPGSLSTGRSAFLNLNGRYRLDTRNSIGAALNLRAITSPGQALLLSWDQTSDWGQTQWRSDFANTGGSRTTRFGVDQGWPVMFPASFNTSLAWERVAGGSAPGSGWIWGLLGSVSPVSQWSLDAALRGAQRSDGARSLNANIGARWLSASGWSLALRYTQARGQEPLSALVVSALTAATLSTVAATPTSRSVQLLLSYEGRAGSARAPLGGLPGSGAGTLGGTVFFDADANGRREASEAGVPGVTIMLDRRFATRTDAQGRYEFPAVAAGEHLIEISPDNVPLPWSPVLRDPVRTTLQVRQLTTVDFAVQRER